MLSWKHAGKAVFVIALTQFAKFSLRRFYRPCPAPSFAWMPLSGASLNRAPSSGQ